jgi:Dolichyl-phosphate-mannose-protein mannosyltransferase
VRDRVAGIPAWGWLGALVLISFAVRALLARGMGGPFIMVDELIYSELAKSFAADLSFSIRGVGASGYGVVYPILIAPAYALFDAVPAAYSALKTIDSLVMSLAAVPAYLLARRVVGVAYALAAAALALCVPSMAYTGTVMTENAFYPIFLLVVLVLVLVLERPTVLRQLVFVLAFALALLTRSQAIAFVPAALTAPFLLALFSRAGLRATLRPFALLYAIFVGGGALVVALQAARGRSLSGLLGAYADVGEKGYDVMEVLRYVAYHLAELDLYVGVIPFAAAIVLVARVRRADPALQAFLAGAVAVFAWFTLVVAAFASEFASRIQERNLFVVVPLFLVALMAWLERGAPRPPVLAWCAAAASAVLVLAIPFERFVTTSAQSDTLMLLPWWSVQDRTGIEWIAELVFLVALVFAAAFLVVPARIAWLLPLVVLAYWAVTFKPIWFGAHGLKQASAGAVFQGIRGVPRDWIDDSVPPGETVAVLWTGRSDRFTVNQNEFFNRRVGQVYYTEAPTPGGVGEVGVAVDPVNGAVRLPDGSPVRDRYVLTDGSIEPDGHPVVRDPLLGMTVWKLDGPLVSTTSVTGLYPNDTWSGPEVTWTRRRCRGGTLTVSLTGDATLFPQGQVVRAAAGRRVRVVPNEQSFLEVPVESQAGVCTMSFTVSPTGVPSEEIPGSDDDRDLGTHFNSFVFAP